MFTDDQLKKMIRKEPISDQYPYPEQDDDLLTKHIQPLLNDFTRANIRYRVASDHFGCGYASYIQIVCWTDQFASVKVVDGERRKSRRGLFVYISRLSPVAAIMNNARQVECFDEAGEVTGCSTQTPIEPKLTIDGKFKPLARDISRILMKHGFTLLQKKFVTQLLPFPADIPTLDRENGTYLVWDAVFYWED